MRRLVTLLFVIGIAIAMWTFRAELQREVPALFLATSPRARYEAWLRLRQLDRTPDGRAWLAAAEHVLEVPRSVVAPFQQEGTFDTSGDAAAAWTFSARRGQRISVTATTTAGRVFIDVFRAATRAHVASAPADLGQLVYDATDDDELIVRVQPELEHTGAYRVVQQSLPSMAFPVMGVSARAVQSGFGSGRDAGRRRHEGVDIFAPRGTPVVAAADGWIGSSRSNTLGGNVVWVWSPFRRVSTYYAHLDRQTVTPGQRVRAGDVVGWVGNTGNARTTPPHLHFGVYSMGHGAVDPLPFLCASPCGGRFAQHLPPGKTAAPTVHAGR